MARPPKDPQDRLSHVVRVCFTSEQLHLLTQRAQQAALDLSPYLRQIALAGQINTPRVPAINLAAIRQLRHLGNNLNQLARYFNTQPPPDDGEVGERIAELRAILHTLARELLGWSAASSA